MTISTTLKWAIYPPLSMEVYFLKIIPETGSPRLPFYTCENFEKKNVTKDYCKNISCLFAICYWNGSIFLFTTCKYCLFFLRLSLFSQRKKFPSFELLPTSSLVYFSRVNNSCKFLFFWKMDWSDRKKTNPASENYTLPAQRNNLWRPRILKN